MVMHGDLTFLYYPNSWNGNQMMEEKLKYTLTDDIITGVPPIPNRMVMFDAALLHRATSFRDRHTDLLLQLSMNLIDK